MNFFDAHGLAGEDRAEIDFLATQANAATARDHDDAVVERIVEIGQSAIGVRGGLVDFRRTLHAESFMGSFGVEDLDEVIEPRLLLKKVGAGWFGGFFFQSEMHALVTTVLLGMARLDAFDADAQAEPPDRELAQGEQGMSGSEGNAVIAADVGGQATLFKKPLKTQ